MIWNHGIAAVLRQNRKIPLEYCIIVNFPKIREMVCPLSGNIFLLMIIMASKMANSIMVLIIILIQEGCPLSVTADLRKSLPK